MEWWQFVLGVAAFVAVMLSIPRMIRAERESRCAHEFEKHGRTLVCTGCGMSCETVPECDHKFEEHKFYKSDEPNQRPVGVIYLCLKCGAERKVGRPEARKKVQENAPERLVEN